MFWEKDRVVLVSFLVEEVLAYWKSEIKDNHESSNRGIFLSLDKDSYKDKRISEKSK